MEKRNRRKERFKDDFLFVGLSSWRKMVLMVGNGNVEEGIYFEGKVIILF